MFSQENIFLDSFAQIQLNLSIPKVFFEMSGMFIPKRTKTINLNLTFFVDHFSNRTLNGWNNIQLDIGKTIRIREDYL